MRTFLITYDLAEPQANRNALGTAIMQLGDAWARPLANTWFVRSRDRRAAIEAKLWSHIDSDDGLVILEVATEAALVNTALRWFQSRACVATGASDNVIAFPRHDAGETDPARAA